MEFGYIQNQKIEKLYQLSKNEIMKQLLEPHFKQFRNFYEFKKNVIEELKQRLENMNENKNEEKRQAEEIKNILQNDIHKTHYILSVKNMIEKRTNPEEQIYKKTVNISLFGDIELNTGNFCSLQCKYCYLDNFGVKYRDNIERKLYPLEKEKETNQKYQTENFLKFLKFCVQNKFTIKQLELFGGDPLFRQVGKKLLEEIYKFYQSVDYEYRPAEIIIPTNITWLIKEKDIEFIKDIQKKFESIGIILALSQSVDGLLENMNRPWINRKMYKYFKKQSHEYYDFLFKMQQELNCGFHPMVYSNGIECWVDNFMWFIKMFLKYDIVKLEDLKFLPRFPIYLLEVRNPEWKRKHMIEFQFFMRFLVMFIKKFLEYCVTKNNIPLEENIQKFIVQKIFEGTYSFNILTNSTSKVMRGIGCSLQTSLMLNSDLSIQQCHRNNYQFMKQQDLKIDENNKLHIKQYNPEIYLGLKMFNSYHIHLCDMCQINYQCAKYCPQQNFEQNKEYFTPIPTVCQLEHIKMFSILLAMIDFELIHQYLKMIPQDIQISCKLILQEIVKNKELQNLLRSRDKYYEKIINNFIYKVDTGKILEEPIFTERELEILNKQIKTE